MSERLFSPEQLAALVSPPRDALLVRLQRGFCQGFVAWMRAILEFVAGRQGAAGVQAVWNPADLLECAAAAGLRPTDATTAAEATEWSEEVDGALRRLHDTYSDCVAMMLSRVHEAWGADELEACLRHSGDRTLVAAMPGELARPPAERIRRAALGLVANFATITVEEHDEAVTIVQSPCGTCGRQLERGRYAPAGPLAVVADIGPMTFDRGDTPIYRCHVPVMHDLMPTERFGHPWPVIECPPGLESDGCRITLWKDPALSAQERGSSRSRTAHQSPPR